MKLKEADWIWIQNSPDGQNRYIAFRRQFAAPAGTAQALLYITACTRYTVWLNGERFGQGPPRSWPGRPYFDTYDLLARLKPHTNLLAVLVHDFGTSTMQHIDAPPGLCAAIEMRASSGVNRVVTDSGWRAKPCGCYLRLAPRISTQLGFEEQFDARHPDAGWQQPDFDDAAWAPAHAVPAPPGMPPEPLRPAGLAFLTRLPRSPERIVSLHQVKEANYAWSIELRHLFNPSDRSALFMRTSGFLRLRFNVEASAQAVLTRVHSREMIVKLDGKDVHASPPAPYYGTPILQFPLQLNKGDHELLLRIDSAAHLPRFAAALSCSSPIRFHEDGDATPWRLVGPFHAQGTDAAELDQFPFTNMPVTTALDAATSDKYDAIWRRGGGAQFDRRIPASAVATHDASLSTIADAPAGAAPASCPPDGLLAGRGEWTWISPPEADHATRLVLDFGEMCVGFAGFELFAAEGTIVDFVGLEALDERNEPVFAESVNNSGRYICREGRQTFLSRTRIGLRYLCLTVRSHSKPFGIGRVWLEESQYPQRNVGSFSCDNARLERIWQVGARTMAVCSEDTYVDCPTYEQVYWVGDARNEALVDWVVNGDPRLWKHNLLLAAYSLERSPLVESHVPSGWPVILPAWAFLWMRSCREYALYTGDLESAGELWPWLMRQLTGIEAHINHEHLFEIRAWNLFDWADMDTPDDGVITHQNCLLVQALRETAELGTWLGEQADSRRCRLLAGKLDRAINASLFHEGRQAFVDCRHANGKPSRVFSQQTQTAALAAGVARGERGLRVLRHVVKPPDDFVKAGSPFFAFFLLEVLRKRLKTRWFYNEIASKWGMMLDRGATTFWEMWSGQNGRQTRSHAHGWSSAPTYFLTTFGLGIEPVQPGFSVCRISPRPGKLKRMHGIMPTPAGQIEVDWERAPERPPRLTVTAPEEIELQIQPADRSTEIEIRRHPRSQGLQ